MAGARAALAITLQPMKSVGDVSASHQAHQAALEGARIVVIGVNYAPESTGIGPYTTGLTRHLSEAGAHVHVITGVPHYPNWAASRGYRTGLMWREQHDGIAVSRGRHYIPRRPNAMKRILFDASFALTAGLLTSHVAADAVIGVTPGLGALPAAVHLSRRTRTPLAVVVQDLAGLAAEQSGIRGPAAMFSFGRRLESRWLRQADLLGVISPDFVEVLTKSGIDSGRLFELRNYTHIVPDDRSPRHARKALGWRDEDFVVLHSGNMGLKQDLGNVLAAAQLADQTSSSVRFVILGDGSQRTHLERAAAGIRSVEIATSVPDDLYPAALAAADVLLLNERPSVKNMSLPSKLTSYLSAGRAILAAVRADSAAAMEVGRSGGGIVVPPGDPAALLAGAMQLQENQDLRRRLAEKGRKYASAELSETAAAQRSVAFAQRLLRTRTQRTNAPAS